MLAAASDLAVANFYANQLDSGLPMVDVSESVFGPDEPVGSSQISR